MKSVKECDERLAKIKIEMKCLKLEQVYVLKNRNLLLGLEKHTPLSTNPNSKLPSQILEVIKTNPGINGRDTKLKLNIDGYSSRQLTDAFSNLRKSSRIVNRGGRGLAARWYIKEVD